MRQCCFEYLWYPLAPPANSNVIQIKPVEEQSLRNHAVFNTSTLAFKLSQSKQAQAIGPCKVCDWKCDWIATKHKFEIVRYRESDPPWGLNSYLDVSFWKLIGNLWRWRWHAKLNGRYIHIVSFIPAHNQEVGQKHRSWHRPPPIHASQDQEPMCPVW